MPMYHENVSYCAADQHPFSREQTSGLLETRLNHIVKQLSCKVRHKLPEIFLMNCITMFDIQ